jgi:hypothetical protein
VRAMVDWIAGGAAGGSDAGTVTTTSGKDSGVTTTLPSFDASTASCTKASNTAQVSAGRATAVGGYAYAKGSNEFLGADTAATSSSLEELTSGYYIVCL